MGRKRLPPDKATRLHNLRMTDADWQRIVNAAELAGETASTVMRRGALKEATRILRTIGEAAPKQPRNKRAKRAER